MPEYPLYYGTNWRLPSGSDNADWATDIQRLAGELDYYIGRWEQIGQYRQYFVNDADYSVEVNENGINGKGYMPYLFVGMVNTTAARTVTLPRVRRLAGSHAGLNPDHVPLIVKDLTGNAATYNITVQGASLAAQPAILQFTLTADSTGTYHWGGSGTAEITLKINGGSPVTIAFTGTDFVNADAIGAHIKSTLYTSSATPTELVDYRLFKTGPYAVETRPAYAVELYTVATGASASIEVTSVTNAAASYPQFTLSPQTVSGVDATQETIQGGTSIVVNSNYGYARFKVNADYPTSNPTWFLV